MRQTTTCSIVVPVFDEEENVEPLYLALKPVLEGHPYEIIFVDDGSRDRTFERLSEIARKDGRVKLVKFRKNFGQSAALAAGFERATGDLIITTDADLQNDPIDIPKLLSKLDEGYDIVCGWRKHRKDRYFGKRVPSKIFNWLASKSSGLDLHDFGCTLRAYRKDAVKDISLYGELHRYIPALAASKGFKVCEIVVSHHPRRYGRTKYGATRLMKGALDLLAVELVERYLARPMHLFGLLGFLSAAAGGIIAGYLAALRLLYDVPIGERPLLLLAVLLMVFGIQFVVFGLLGEMMTRYQYESGAKRFYEIQQEIGFES